MTDLRWEHEEFADGSVEVTTFLGDEIVRKDRINVPVGAGREYHINKLMLSIIADYEVTRASQDLRRQSLELHNRIRDLMTRVEGHREGRASPPFLGALFISFLAPEKTAQVQLGDLQEIFQKNLQRCGEREARRIYWMQVAQSAWPLLWGWVKRIGLVTFLVDYVRSKFGF